MLNTEQATLNSESDAITRNRGMSEINCTTATTETIKPAATARRIMSELWDRAADSLSTEELKWFAGSSEFTRMQARNLSEVVEGIGCLIGSDENAGNFQEAGSVTTLLFNISHSIDTIAGMMEISDFAQDRLINADHYQRLKEYKKKYAAE
ncbi:MAG TPA: hypothetical protein VFK88_02530 [Gallionella sp.]|nr:hypothetical protein [Gallionella sp.]